MPQISLVQNEIHDRLNSVEQVIKDVTLKQIEYSAKIADSAGRVTENDGQPHPPERNLPLQKSISQSIPNEGSIKDVLSDHNTSNYTEDYDSYCQS